MERNMNTETASPKEKKTQPRWQFINHPQASEFQGIAYVLYSLCGLGYIICDLTPAIQRALIVATIFLVLSFIYSFRKQ
jgi:hypothetical protein